MRLVVMKHRIPHLRPPKWEWVEERPQVWTSWPEGRAWYVIHRRWGDGGDGWIAKRDYQPRWLGCPVAYPVAGISRWPELVAMWWAWGIPAIRTNNLDRLRALVEALHPYIVPCPRPLLPVVGFRAYCTRKLNGVKIPWWQWSPSTHAACDLGHAAPDHACDCGYHVAHNPWSLAYYLRPSQDHRILVVAPRGRVIQHEFGARAERYEVVACVAPWKAQLAPEEEADPRLIRARNLPLRAWEVARKLARGGCARPGGS